MGGKTKPIVAAVISVCVVVAVVVPCVVLLPKDSAGDDPVDPSTLPKFDYDDLYTDKYNYEYLYPNWDDSTASTTDYVTMQDNADIVNIDLGAPNDPPTVLFPGSLFTDNSYQGYSLSATTDYVVYWKDYKKVWRHSYLANFYVYAKSDPTTELGATVAGFPRDGKIHYVEWSPVGNKLAIVYGWDLWYIDFDADTPALVRITDDGEENKVYNGIPDWVYEEESIGTNNVLYWSPQATRLAYLKTNDTNTNIIEYSMYDQPQYPRTVKIAYPKAGTPIGEPELYVYDLALDASLRLDAPSEFQSAPEGFYFHRFVWNNEDIALPTWTNRVQDKSIAQWCIYDSDTTSMPCTLTGKNNIEDLTGKCWVGSFNPFDVKPAGSAGDYFTIYARPNDGDDSDGYWQIAYLNPSNLDDAAMPWVTKTNYDIVELLHYDEEHDFLYFLAVYPENRDRHVMRVKSTDRDRVEPELMTGELMTKYEDRCRWIAPSFNPTNDHVVINCRGPMVPLTVRIPIDPDTGAWDPNDVVLKSNDDLANKIKQVQWPVREFQSFKSQSGYSYNYELWKPATFDPKKKYPLLIEVYAGPEFQKITSTWTKALAQTYMVSERDIIVASVDGRGSAYQGYKFMREVYKQLGIKEPQDQTEFANYMADNFDYIDRENIAIWGWSYGGYTTSHTLGYDGNQANPIFKCGVAVAPLASWRYYDAMYAERYLRMPDENKAGYDGAEIFKESNVKGFQTQNAWYTLIHGTSDDNVHFQNAAMMEKTLVQADVDFDDFFYADQAHSINIGNAKVHVYRQIDHRLSSCLGKLTSYYPESYLDVEKTKSSDRS